MLLASAPQLLDNPCCDIVNRLPWGFFLLVHIALFAAGTVFALTAINRGRSLLGAGFALFALAEIVYMSYHVNITQFLFAHTIAEVLNGTAFTLLFAGALSRGRDRNAHPVATSSRTAKVGGR